MNVQEITDRMEDVISTGSDKYRAQCPHHGGRSRSLAITQDDDRILLHCFAGCAVHEILGSIGLSVSDLFDKPFEASPADRKDWVKKQNAREILNAIHFPIEVVMNGVTIQMERKLTKQEQGDFNKAVATVKRAMAQRN